MNIPEFEKLVPGTEVKNKDGDIGVTMEPEPFFDSKGCGVTHPCSDRCVFVKYHKLTKKAQERINRFGATNKEIEAKLAEAMFVIVNYFPPGHDFSYFSKIAHTMYEYGDYLDYEIVKKD
jgi:hypothetical protein